RLLHAAEGAVLLGKLALAIVQIELRDLVFEDEQIGEAVAIDVAGAFDRHAGRGEAALLGDVAEVALAVVAKDSAIARGSAVVAPFDEQVDGAVAVDVDRQTEHLGPAAVADGNLAALAEVALA